MSCVATRNLAILNAALNLATRNIATLNVALNLLTFNILQSSHEKSLELAAVALKLCSMTGEGGFAEDQGAYGADPLSCLGEELREHVIGECRNRHLERMFCVGKVSTWP